MKDKQVLLNWKIKTFFKIEMNNFDAAEKVE